MGLSNKKSEVELLQVKWQQNRLRIIVRRATPATLAVLADRRPFSKVSGCFRHTGSQALLAHGPHWASTRLGIKRWSLETMSSCA